MRKQRTNLEFINELSQISPTIIPKTPFTGVHKHIDCECSVCGTIWSPIAKTLLAGMGCPKCGRKKAEVAHSNNSFEKFKKLLSKRNDLIMVGSWAGYDTKTKLHCSVCGNDWETTPHNIANSRGCPVCGLKSRIKSQTKPEETFLQQMKEVHPELIVLGSYKNYKEKIKCRCTKCGNVFEMTPNHLLCGHGCTCFHSLGERYISQVLSKWNVAYVSQKEIPKEYVNDLKVRVDFYLGEFIIEYNGLQHYEPVEYFGGKEQFSKQCKRDQTVRDFCKDGCIELIEIPYTIKTIEEIENTLEPVIKMGELSKTLISIDNKSKIRVVKIRAYWDEETSSYVIDRKTGLLNGKETQQPFIYITSGKAGRTSLQQCELEFNSNFKKYLDKGYKDVSDYTTDELTSEKCAEILGDTKTDANGVMKPMLCKLLDKDNKKLTEKEWYGSYKHDGVRMLLFMRDGEVHTSSRGGGDYDIAATYIREDPYIVKILTNNPGLVLDGELYKHGKPLSWISGLVRKETLEEDHKLLTYHCYDIVDESATFKNRVKRLNELKKDCPSDSKLIIIEQRLIKGLDSIMKMHNEAVANGYEGLVIKDPDKEYKCGARDNRALKIKEFQDAEFKILGIVEGLRDEDMCFLMETEDGTQFKAKPIGDRALKQQYRENIDNIIGKMGTVKFFGWTNTEHPVPNLPSFRSIRDEKDI